MMAAYSKFAGHAIHDDGVVSPRLRSRDSFKKRPPPDDDGDDDELSIESRPIRRRLPLSKACCCNGLRPAAPCV
jgi:hypothetical protein